MSVSASIRILRRRLGRHVMLAPILI